MALAGGVDAFFEFVETHPYAWRMIFRDPPADPELVAVHRRIQDRASREIAAMLASFDPPGSARSPTRLALVAEGLKAAINGLAAWWYDTPTSSGRRSWLPRWSSRGRGSSAAERPYAAFSHSSYVGPTSFAPGPGSGASES